MRPPKADLASTFRLALPVIVVELGLMAMGTVDTMFVGRVSADAVAAVAIGHTYFWVVVIIGFGILFALDPLITQAVGAKDTPAVSLAVQRGLLLSVLLAVVTGMMLLPGEAVLRFLRQPEAIIPAAAAFARASTIGVLPLYVFIVIRLLLQAHDRTRPLVIAVVVANLVNAFLNWVLVFGRLGFAPMGPVGSGWASSVSRWALLATLLAVCWRELRPHLRPWRVEAFAGRPMLRILGIGIPIFIQYELEVNAFAVVAVMMGWISTTAMAGHQISINLAALTFMVPLGVSAAGAVRVGRAVGAADPAAVRGAAGAALAIGIAFMSVSAVTMLTVPHLLARAYSADPVILAAAIMLLPFAGLFQVFDGIQVVCVGILRGTGDTRTPMIINILGFWLVGVPVSAYLGLRTSLEARGLWIGFVFGLAAVAALLLLRVRMRLRQTLVRLRVE